MITYRKEMTGMTAKLVLKDSICEFIVRVKLYCLSNAFTNLWYFCPFSMT